ncbi:acyl carrier protein [Nocardiopsis sediminis]|uniref:Acyl carrier protein n=1 Tax=Nocardiopsis sediminis TaxID=1778267 RepID=A0ABV8FE39_9ACTN
MTDSVDGVSELRAWLIEEVARRTATDPRRVDPALPFSALGLTSRGAAELTGALEVHMGRPVPTLLAWQYPSIDTLARHLVTGAHPAAAAGPAPAAGAPAEEPFRR